MAAEDGFSRFTARARNVVMAAQNEAKAARNAEITPEHLALGVLSRAAPQMNILAVAFPVQIGLGLLALFVVPGLLALRYGRRAMRAGDPGGLAPVVVGATVAVAFVGVNLLGFVAQVLL